MAIEVTHNTQDKTSHIESVEEREESEEEEDDDDE